MFTHAIRLFILTFLLTFACLTASASDARIKKVLPQLIDSKGRNSLSPSLYARDAYQFILRNDSEKRAGVRFVVKWSGERGEENLRLRLQLRGMQENNVQVAVLELPVQKKGWFSQWSTLELRDAPYKNFGELIAWRATLWKGDQLLSEQKSFLW